MKKLLIFFLTIFSTYVLQADEDLMFEKPKDSYAYFVIGCFTRPFTLPVVGLGCRLQFGHNGLDVGVQGMGLPRSFFLKSNLTYLYYPKPKLQGQVYIGAGIGLEEGQAEIPSKGRIKAQAFSPEFVFGHQRISSSGKRRFIEVQGSPVIITPKGDVAVFPCVVFRYGIGF
ncbi:MAG: hypothetical protein SNF33_00240 (plasmid) [Candidatus Algichlamydia australiensis]|nr:hypothetical protein [Chlamydiales bacterium]